ncbi:quinone-dependent dihydroorotate dehydrogenase [Rhizosaccharibacter radicis]|uniref:Dihydroorotate dehydrogenase (quinone) n=1 Tax=Rhizosaccharibacter radicis TaxID=2782605 RepID=A0ABT1VZR1_9PROT|nr:quinone-dependent dihydroorotate dehydrogenase [Acetobacteraceae bacterium KSS12]
MMGAMPVGDLLSRAALPLLHRVDPERAHRLATTALLFGLAGRAPPDADDMLAVDAMGLRFPNPIGLAAGFDKDARVVRPLARLGFGLVEAGTVTLRPQPGNPAPRLFRLPEDGAVINRMGFNNGGVRPFRDRLRRLAEAGRRGRGAGVPVGANVGINKDSADPERDYAAMVRLLAPHADYLVMNLSSPNTPGLRALQDADRMRALLGAIAAAAPVRPPLLVKLAPDLPFDALPAIVDAVVAGGAQGLIVSNTTLDRAAELRGAHRGETGGLSGRPLRAKSTAMLREVSRLADGRLVLVGCGGIETGADILEKLRAGAHLVQIYTRFIWEGAPMLPRLKRELRDELRRHGWRSVRDAVGAAR